MNSEEISALLIKERYDQYVVTDIGNFPWCLPGYNYNGSTPAEREANLEPGAKAAKERYDRFFNIDRRKARDKALFAPTSMRAYQHHYKLINQTPSSVPKDSECSNFAYHAVGLLLQRRTITEQYNVCIAGIMDGQHNIAILLPKGAVLSAADRKAGRLPPGSLIVDPWAVGMGYPVANALAVPPEQFVYRSSLPRMKLHYQSEKDPTVAEYHSRSVSAPEPIERGPHSSAVATPESARVAVLPPLGDRRAHHSRTVSASAVHPTPRPAGVQSDAASAPSSSSPPAPRSPIRQPGSETTNDLTASATSIPVGTQPSSGIASSRRADTTPNPLDRQFGSGALTSPARTSAAFFASSSRVAPDYEIQLTPKAPMHESVQPLLTKSEFDRHLDALATKAKQLRGRGCENAADRAIVFYNKLMVQRNLFASQQITRTRQQEFVRNCTTLLKNAKEGELGGPRGFFGSVYFYIAKALRYISSWGKDVKVTESVSKMQDVQNSLDSLASDNGPEPGSGGMAPS